MNKNIIEWKDIQFQDKSKREAMEWMHEFENKLTKKALCICGISGVGKSTFARALYSKASYSYIESTANQCRTKKALLNKFDTVVKNKSLMYYLENKKIGLLIDELDASLHCEKNIFSVLKKDILPNITHNPVILICNSRHTIQKLKQYVRIITLQPLSDRNVCDYISLRLPNLSLDTVKNIVKNVPNLYANINECLELMKSTPIQSVVENYNGKSDISNIPLSKEDQFRYLVKEQHLSHSVKNVILQQNAPYFTQVIFENLYQTAPIDVLDTYILSKKIDFVIHNEQSWDLQKYPEYFDASLISYIPQTKINVIPKIYSKISQYLYQNKTYNELQHEFGLQSLKPDIISILILGICSTNESYRKTLTHQTKNGLRRIGNHKDYWKKIMRKWKS